MCINCSCLSGAAKSGVDLDAGYFVIGPELEDISSSAAPQAINDEDFETAEQYLHPDVVAWHKKKKFSYAINQKKKKKTNKTSTEI